jgi:hypothetical protein
MVGPGVGVGADGADGGGMAAAWSGMVSSLA